MEPLHFRPERLTRELVERAFRVERARLRRLLPAAEIEHMGSTAVPGALTKGDLDLLVRVDAEAFPAAVARLRGAYAVHQPENWSPTFASFVDASARTPPVGVQLVVRGAALDADIVAFREALVADRELLERYNTFKADHEGEPYESYTDAKAEFIERALAATARSRP